MTPTTLSQYVKDLRKQYHLTQGKNTLRMDKVNQVLNLFGAELAPVKQVIYSTHL